MPWMEASRMSQRQEFVLLAQAEQANMRQLCRRFGISPVTGYKWLGRFQEGGVDALQDQSRRPRYSPHQTPAELERLVVELRREHPAWGGRKLRARLLALDFRDVPAASTMTDILRRHGLLGEAENEPRSFVRFQRPYPNDLWQMDFKGDFALLSGRCHPLTILDDHSRFNLALRACPNQRGQTVWPHLVEVFRRYGLPREMLCDNGAPWGTWQPGGLTRLGAQLVRLGIVLRHGEPFHPQTQGKDERFHRTLKAEVLNGRTFADLTATQRAFDPWRDVYNLQRPHEALEMATPASRYQPSPRAYPQTRPPIEYGPDDLVRQADHQGYVTFHKRKIHISDGAAHQPVGFRPTSEDGVWDVYFCHQKLDTIDLRSDITGGERY
jgi:transposase InsO family protein